MVRWPPGRAGKASGKDLPAARSGFPQVAIWRAQESTPRGTLLESL